MAQIFNATLQGLMPSQDSPAYATPNPVNMPYGGPYGVGGTYTQGQPISIVAGTIQSEVITVTIAGATGTLVFTFTADQVYQASWLVAATTAVAQTALENIFGVGNVTVTGTAGTTYTITLSGALANQRIGGLVAVSATGSPTVARTTRGSSGAGQYDLYDSSTFTVVKGFLEYTFGSSPQGFISTPDIGFNTEQPQSMPAWTRGRFFVSDLVTTGTYALDTDAMTQGNLIFVRGTALTDVGAEVELL